MPNITPDYFLALTETPTDGSVETGQRPIVYGPSGADFPGGGGSSATRFLGGKLSINKALPSQFSVALKVRLDATYYTTGFSTVLNWENNSDIPSIGFTNTQRLRVLGSDTPGALPLGDILQIALSVDQVAKQTVVWVDGLKVLETSFTLRTANSYGLEMGALTGGLGVGYDRYPLDGVVQDFGIFDRLLTSTELEGISDGTNTYSPITQPTIDGLDPASGPSGSAYRILTDQAAEINSVYFRGVPRFGWDGASGTEITGLLVPDAWENGAYPVTIESDGGISDPVFFTVSNETPITENSFAGIQGILVDNYSPRTSFVRATTTQADGFTAVRFRRNTPPEYLAQVSFRLYQDQAETLLDFLATQSQTDDPTLWEGPVRVFGQETGDGPLACRVKSVGKMRRLGYDDFIQEVTLVLSDPVGIETFDPQALEKVPWDWTHELNTTLDGKSQRSFGATTWSTWGGNEVHRSVLTGVLTLDELEEVRKMYYGGHKADPFPLTMDAPIFGEGAGYSHQVRILRLTETPSSRLVRSVQVELEKVA